MGFSSFEATYYFEPRGNTLLVEDMVARELCYRLLEFKFIFAHRTLSFGGCKGHKLLLKKKKKRKKKSTSTNNVENLFIDGELLANSDHKTQAEHGVGGQEKC